MNDSKAEQQSDDGPECPGCGCMAFCIIRAPKPGGWFAAGRAARCDHCGRVFSLPAEPKEQRDALSK